MARGHELETASETPKVTALAGALDPSGHGLGIPTHLIDSPSHKLQAAVANPVLAHLLRKDDPGGGHSASAVRIELTQVLPRAIGLCDDPTIAP